MKILYVTTISNTVNAFLIPHIKMLIEEGHQVDVAFNIEQEVKPEVFEMGCKVYELPLQRSPLRRDNFRAYGILQNIIISEGYDLVHTHTPVASAIVRVACRNLDNVRVFYTSHGFHFYKDAPLINWLFYYPAEKWLARYTDTLITINKEDYDRAMSFKTCRVEYIPGVGIDLVKFNTVAINKDLKRIELGLPEDAFVVLSVGELNKNKNHEIVIKAIAKLNNPIIHYIICGKGPLKSYLEKLAFDLGVQEKVHLLGYRKDIAEICKISDLFVFPSYREGLPVSLMEAIASGLSVICSDIRGNTDLIVNHKGGLLFKPSNIEEIEDSINNLFYNRDVLNSFALYNAGRIKDFEYSVVVKEMERIYKQTNGE